MGMWDTPRSLDALLWRFRAVFNASQYENFRRYVGGLVLVTGRRNVLSISRLYLDSPDQSTLNRFLLGSRWSRSRLAHLRHRLARDMTRTQDSKEKFFIVDDTTLARSNGYTVEGAGIHHGGTGKNCRIRGHCIVTSHLVCGDLSLPLKLQLYDKRRVPGCIRDGKIALACGLVKHPGLPLGRGTIFLADSWYFCRDLVDAASRRGWDWIFGVHSNRVIWFEGRQLTISKVLNETARRPAEHRRGHSRRIWGMECMLPGIGPVQVVFWRLPGRGCKTRCLVTNRRDWSPEAVVARYARRGRIEMFYWACKQFLGLGEYRVRKAAAALAHWEFVFCAYTLLLAIDLARPRQQHLRTIGRLCDWLTGQAFVDSLRRAYTQGRLGMAWSLERCAEEPAGYGTAAQT